MRWVRAKRRRPKPRRQGCSCALASLTSYWPKGSEGWVLNEGNWGCWITFLVVDIWVLVFRVIEGLWEWEVYFSVSKQLECLRVMRWLKGAWRETWGNSYIIYISFLKRINFRDLVLWVIHDYSGILIWYWRGVFLFMYLTCMQSWNVCSLLGIEQWSLEMKRPHNLRQLGAKF